MRDFTGRTAVVTGAASGIGFAIAQRCASEGMKVVLADIEQGALDAAVAEVKGLGAEAIGVVTNVADPDAVDALATTAADSFGSVHLLVNNAGVGHRGRVWDIALKDWQWVMGVCFWGAVHGVRSFVPGMIGHGEPAHVVNTSSWNGLGAAAWGGPYNSAKHAVTALTETLFYDLADEVPQVGVSLLCPGYTATGITRSRRNHPDVRGAAPSAGSATAPSPAPSPAPAAAPAARSAAPGEPKRPPVTWAPPASVADVLFDAITENRFYVYADAETWIPILSDHVQAMLDGGNPVPVALRG